MIDNHKLGNNIKNFRELLGLSQDAIAAFLGVQREVVSYYENGKRKVSIEHLHKLADLFGIEPLELIEEDEAINNADLAFAFRNRNSFTVDDLNTIASFKRIVKNYFKLLNLERKYAK